MSLSKTYTAYYAETSGNLAFYKKALIERPNRAVILAAEKGGEHAVQAMFDAIIDSGDRNVLVQALNSPNLPQWVRDRLETLLYGSHRQSVCALLLASALH
jgi:hypothetical protein